MNREMLREEQIVILRNNVVMSVHVAVLATILFSLGSSAILVATIVFQIVVEH